MRYCEVCGAEITGWRGDTEDATCSDECEKIAIADARAREEDDRHMRGDQDEQD